MVIKKKRKFISRQPKPTGLSQEWIQNNFKYKYPEFQYRLFDESGNGPFEVPLGRIKTYDKNKSLPDAPKLYNIQENESACVFC